MKGIQKLLAILLILLSGCVATNASFDGTGGKFFGPPNPFLVNSGKIDFDPDKFASLAVGATTKKEVIEKLGKPQGWETRKDGTSFLQYLYVSHRLASWSRVIHPGFEFDQNKILIIKKNTTWEEIDPPGEYETILNQFVNYAQSGDIENMLSLTSDYTINNHGLSKMTDIYKQDYSPALKLCGSMSEGGANQYLTPAQSSTGYGWVFIKTCSGEKFKNVKLKCVVLNEGGKIVVTTIDAI